MPDSTDAKRTKAATPAADPGTLATQEDPSMLFAGRGASARRVEAGKAARSKVPREKLAECKVTDRDPIALLDASNAGRVTELIPIRYGRMVANPFAFYRGAAPLMAHDLSKLPHSDVIVQLGGDAHLANFGLFASPERRILFGPNDFDETLPGPFDWDVRRLATSFVIAARERGFAQRDQRGVVRRLCETFRQQIAEFSRMDTLDIWYAQFNSDNMLAIADSAQERQKEQAVIDKAKQQSSRSVVNHATELVNGKLRIKDQPPLVYHVPFESPHENKQYDAMVRRFFADYRLTLPDDRRTLFDRYELVDVAIRVVGIGSVGTRCYEALFMADGQCPLFLQLKEARASVLEGYLPPSRYPNHGQRVVNGQRLLQSASDIFLGWSKMRHTGNDFYVRQLRDMKGAFDFTTFDVEDLGEYAVSCAHALAHSMAKAGDPALLSGYVGKSDAFDEAIVQFALAYADQNEADWTVLKSAVKAGRIQVIRE
ncbi:DUF2252 domain-containing protein [Paraburkholderia sp. Ac-20336]|uniref:DUF2252 domain-containing protein n=1 Tax=unclassified Paraburkholderia TaxID=2615204 RepID=UPI0014227673|nr:MULTISPECIES: DUF2252 domain-containing protein [unclassified Paraburkholderia]MBN3802277.1 DUF2252 domain-containing protein [Paraburkholderia sp. Ac-20336]MBN3845829.1 DUF2252 domain-containing protein [Paraburkholderia sp. Ac-20342]NIF77395.1 DUF2252 domain-containing protein [Paraburkholderia sp. Cy-641]